MPPLPPPTPSAPQCTVCGQGLLQRKRVYRMSGPAVVIGFILLIPSILGILFGGLTFLLTVVGVTNLPANDPKIEPAKSRMAAEGVPKSIIDDVVAGKHIDENRLIALTQSQQIAVRTAQLTVSSATVATGTVAACGMGFSAMIMIGSFVSGLLGWLLIMRKMVLQCFRCGAVVAAS